MNFRYTVLFIISILFLSGCSSDMQIQEYEEKINELENKIYDLELEIEYLEDDLDRCMTQREEYKEYYDYNCDVDEFEYEFD